MLESPATVSSADGTVKLSFRANTTFTMQGDSLSVAVEPSPPAPPSGTRLIVAYRFSPSGTSFSPAAVLMLKYDPSSLPSGTSESSLTIAHWDGSAWMKLPSTVDTAAKVVSAEISHFSVFALLGGTTETMTPAPTPARFSITDLKVNPLVAAPGQTVAITATVINSGGSQGSYTIALKVNGVTEAEKEVSLSPGATGTVTFTVSKSTPGSYEVTVGDKSGNFEVRAPAAEKGGSGIWLAIGAGAILLLVVILLVLLLRRS